MSWTRIDDRILSHPKVLRLIGRYGADGVLALGWWVLVMAGPANGTGNIDPEAARFAFLDKIDPDLVAPMLLEVGLLDQVDGGWAIHDYAYWHSPAVMGGKERAASGRRSAGGTFAPADTPAGDQPNTRLAPARPSVHPSIHPSSPRARARENGSEDPTTKKNGSMKEILKEMGLPIPNEEKTQ